MATVLIHLDAAGFLLVIATVRYFLAACVVFVVDFLVVGAVALVVVGAVVADFVADHA